jgi:hypothetical protein
MQVTPNKGLNFFIFFIAVLASCMGSVVEWKNVMAKNTGSSPNVFFIFRRMFNLNLH